MALTASEGTELGFSRQDSEKLEEGVSIQVWDGRT